MRRIILLLIVVSVVKNQLRFGGNTGANVKPRLGDSEGRTSSFTQGEEQLCCCVPSNTRCGDPNPKTEKFEDEFDFVGSGAIDARIVNRPSATTNSNTNSQQNGCSSGEKLCCYNLNQDTDVSVFGRSCKQPSQPVVDVSDRFTQSCSERVSTNGKKCGTRDNFKLKGHLRNLKAAQVSPGEFPWTCLILNEDNDFIGTCALIPGDKFNDNYKRGVRVITAAHKLKCCKGCNGVRGCEGQFKTLKIRVGEYDASGYEAGKLEEAEHEEYNVTGILKHPRFNKNRLSYDIALLKVKGNINLNHPYVNTACLPTCKNQFDYQFNNGTGVRCWVAGWGKDDFNGDFQIIPHKVDLPLVDKTSCNNKLKDALNKQRPRSGNSFKLSESEICAGGQIGKDACTGDGGSPLVCQSAAGQWTVVGLVTWGVGCANDVPGVYLRVSEFLQWIRDN